MIRAYLRRRRVRRRGVSAPDALRCVLCGYRAPSNVAMRRHRQMRHPDAPSTRGWPDEVAL